MDRTPLSISELTSRIKIVLEGGLPALWIRGEVSQFTSHRSGHSYFTLCDDQTQLSCVLWRGRARELNYTPQVGDLVVAFGRVVVYERGGRYQFDCYDLRPAGLGELAQAFEALKQKLAAEGLFALERKIPLPPLPERVGLVTSPGGAALQDILKVARERAPWVEFHLAPANVQGPGAAAEIAAAIRALDQSGWPQVIIVGRGGGSPEDLWAFNEAPVVRAVAECRTPIVSAVGHEVDVTLSDLAADLRAPTPSAAAEMCLPDRHALRARLEEAALRAQRAVTLRLAEKRRWLTDRAAPVLAHAMTGRWREESQRVDEISRRLDRGVRLLLERRREALQHLGARLDCLDPRAILERGYAIVRRAGDPQPLTDAARLQAEDEIEVAFHRGGATARVTSTHHD
ncbi:MAG: exodeoxyribonuclease VII large subunit [Candidatus Zixiibacteriota bacterium]|nr:MAG: exodeoxyribonuclease VII large subunit [candidate division Zixibacteria bacterium]